MTFSVIIPVYNVEKYLSLCLESVIPALEQQDEIILSLGCSNDKSTELSEQYTSRYPNIRTVYQSGKGLSNARNCAMQVAKGAYILFIDGDDFVNTSELKTLLCDIRNESYAADVVMTDFYRYYDTTQTSKRTEQIGHRNLTRMEALPQVVRKRQCFWNVWRCIYSKIFLTSHDLFFQENTHGEDIDFTTRVLLAEPNIAYVDAPFYYYRMGRTGSLMNSIPYSRVQETVDVLRKSISALRDSRRSWSHALISCFQFEYVLNLALIQELQPSDRAEAETLFSDYRQVLTPSEDWLVNTFCWCMRIAGIQTTSRLLSAAKKIKRKREHRTL